MSKILNNITSIVLFFILLAVGWFVFYSHSIPETRSPPAENGIIDMTGIDFDTTLVRLEENWDFHPEQLLTPQDFVSGTPEKQVRTDEHSATPYGTHRILLRLPPSRHLLLHGGSIDYGMRAFVNGVPSVEVGAVADNPDDAVPRVNYYTIPIDTGESGIVELVYQYSNFVHNEGGGVGSLRISTPVNIERYKSASTLPGALFSGGLLFLFLYYVLDFCVRRKRESLIFAVCCLLFALNNQQFFVTQFIKWDYDWFFFYRFAVLLVMLAVFALYLLLESFYPHAVKRSVTLLFSGIVGLHAVLVFVRPTTESVSIIYTCFYLSLPFIAWLLFKIGAGIWKTRNFEVKDALTLSAFGLLLVTVLIETLWQHILPSIIRGGLTPFGMIVFALVMIVVIGLRTEEELAETQAAQAEVEERARIALYEKELAEQASRSKSDFLATMSHEIRTPMNAILGVAQIEMQKDGVSEDYISAFEKIYESGNGLLGIINDILDLSKIESGKLELNPAPYDVAGLVSSAVQLNITRIESKPIEFILDIDETLPSMLFGDELRLRQILNNLLSNAAKYTDKGSIKLSVRYSVSSEKRDELTLWLKVEDTGQGMKPEDKIRLFSENYLRFNAEANRATEGTGLGLNITKNLVELMDGTISVQSELGSGSVFSVYVKQKAVKCSPLGAEVAASLRGLTYADNARRERRKVPRSMMPYGKVLIVDDLKSNLYVAVGLLSQYKLNIKTAISGFDAIKRVEAGGTYDIIFMDHMMPGMDGIEATKKLRELGYEGAIIALTANALAGNEEMFRENGFDGFISKPIDVQQLDAVLNEFVRDRHTERP